MFKKFFKMVTLQLCHQGVVEQLQHFKTF